MSPQQIAMLENLKRRNINEVIIKPNNQFEADCADATLTKNNVPVVVKFDSPYGEYSATIDQLKAYYELQNKR